MSSTHGVERKFRMLVHIVHIHDRPTGDKESDKKAGERQAGKPWQSYSHRQLDRQTTAGPIEYEPEGLDGWMGKTPFARKQASRDGQTASRGSECSQGGRERRERGTDCGPVWSKLDREKVTGVCVCGCVCVCTYRTYVCVCGRQGVKSNQE